MSFGPGDLAVYPAHGVGRIEAMEQRIIGSLKYDFLVMRILENGMKIMIPAQNVREVGLRPLMGKRDVKKIFELFKACPKASENANWNRRHREYMEKIKTGSPYETAEVMGELMAMRTAKELSFGERKLLDTVKALLVKEVALASNKTENEIETTINAFFPPPKYIAVPDGGKIPRPH